MEHDNFPIKGELVQLDQLRINRNLKKHCTCTNRKFVVDTTNKQVHCSSCGTQIDPFEAVVDMAKWFAGVNEELKRLYEQANALSKYKPWLKVIKNLESHYRGHKMIPSCPRCDEPFYLEELTRWTGKSYADRRIQHWNDMKKAEQEES